MVEKTVINFLKYEQIGEYEFPSVFIIVFRAYYR